MFPMYETARHEPLIEPQWDEERVVAAIDEIVRDTYSRFDPQKLAYPSVGLI